MNKERETLDEAGIEGLLADMATALREALQTAGRDDPVMIGIQRGGVWLAHRLHAALGIEAPVGELNIAFYRDDFSRIGMHPSVEPSRLPFDVENRDVVLVDDILYTGRTVRAGLNEIFDYGRPASVLLAALVDRGGRELPVQADVVGTCMQLADHEHVKLLGPDPLKLVVQRVHTAP